MTLASKGIIQELSSIYHSFLTTSVFTLVGIVVRREYLNTTSNSYWSYFKLVTYCSALLSAVYLVKALSYFVVTHTILRTLKSKMDFGVKEVVSYVSTQKFSVISGLFYLGGFGSIQGSVRTYVGDSKQTNYSLSMSGEFGLESHRLWLLVLLLAFEQFTYWTVMKVYSEDNRIFTTRNIYDYSLKMRVLRNTLLDTFERWNSMRLQNWNLQIDSQRLTQTTGLAEDIVRIESINSVIRIEEKKALITQELKFLSDEAIMLNDARFRVYMTLKSHFFTLFEEGVLSMSSLDILVEACDKSAKRDRTTQTFWKTVETSLPTLNYLRALSKYSKWLGNITKDQLIDRLTQVFEVVTVIEKATETLKRNKESLSMLDNILALVMQELDENLEQATGFLGEVQLEFNDFIISIRTKRASLELLKFKLSAFKRNAKHSALPLEEYEDELSNIIKMLNMVESATIPKFSLPNSSKSPESQETGTSGLMLFITNNIFFEKLTPDQAKKLPYLLM